MWRQQACSANPDSDQSISDDDQDLGHNWPGNCLSLAASTEKKEGLEILSRLERLKGTLESGTKTSILPHEPRSSNCEDDVEMPNFYDEGDSVCPPEKAISKDEENNVLPKLSARVGAKKFSDDSLLRVGIEKQGSLFSWSSASKEAEALMHLNEHASCNSRPKKSSKLKGKGKPRFSFRFQSHKGLSSPATSKDENNLSSSILEAPERLDVMELRTEENLVAELPEDIQVEEENMSEIIPHEVEALRHKCSEQSMAELLYGLQDNASLLRGNSEKNSSKIGKRLQPVVRRNISMLGDRTVNKEDSPDLVESSGSSSDSETSDKDLEIAMSVKKGQTMVDQFQEALGATFLNDKPQGSGLFLKLQQVMQREKEQEMDFVQKLKNGEYQNEPNCIYVKILTRCLDGKLTVCDCLFSDNIESLAWSEPLKETASEGTKRTIIFNPRVPNSVDSVNVDLEVGNCIRIHPPWKEIQVGNDKIIILATYFSNFQLTSPSLAEEV
ncbi:uncharacterized protein LOC21392416 isoform X1 [Morus notabilis]|uniref:uncharacterized protein LOC21392416 isoform X1 n=2 Tax=Morus notabilis TaxID=981085 RepID=UPI000CED25B0|nr:uncharacterized protein LOC21392416 isoform X1 [Morus notabilis]